MIKKIFLPTILFVLAYGFWISPDFKEISSGVAIFLFGMLFLEEVEEVIDRLKANPKPALFEQDMHFLKSSALNLGFKALTALCAVGEREAAAGNFEAVPLAPLFKTYDASKAEFVARA